MEEVTDTASFQPSCDDGACGRGGLSGAFIMPYGDVSPRSGVMIQDMGENLQNSRSFSPTHRFLPPPTVSLQR